MNIGFYLMLSIYRFRASLVITFIFPLPITDKFTAVRFPFLTRFHAEKLFFLQFSDDFLDMCLYLTDLCFCNHQGFIERWFVILRKQQRVGITARITRRFLHAMSAIVICPSPNYYNALPQFRVEVQT
jgi:hypothetical protein